MKDDGGKKAGFAHVNLLSCAKVAVLHTWVGTPLIIVDFDVVIIDPIASIDVLHRQPGSRGGTHSASLRSALLPSPASSQPRELVSGRHLPLPEAVGRPRPPRPPDCPAAPLSIVS